MSDIHLKRLLEYLQGVVNHQNKWQNKPKLPLKDVRNASEYVNYPVKILNLATPYKRSWKIWI